MKRFAKNSNFGSLMPAARLRGGVIRKLAAKLCVGIALAAWAPAWAQSFTVVYSFPSYAPPGWFARPLVVDGAVYGINDCGAACYGAIFRINVNGTGFTNLKSFPPTIYNGTSASTNSDGAGPLGGLVSDGETLYGATSSGGHLGFGTVFSLKPNGSGFTVLKHFAGRPDGKTPY